VWYSSLKQGQLPQKNAFGKGKNTMQKKCSNIEMLKCDKQFWVIFMPHLTTFSNQIAI